MLELIKKLEKLSPRKGKNEKKAAELIKTELESFEIFEQKFFNSIPEGKAELICDGEKIPCEASALKTGRIEEKCLISSIHVSARIFFHSNINFNPYCNEISLATFYHAPSIAVEKSYVQKIIEVEEIKGKVKVKKKRFLSRNLLIGNIKNPKAIVFTHYDSVINGAVDNSSGVAVCIKVLKNNPELAKKVLFVFSGSEELSFDFPIYWGKGYRVFEEEYLTLLKKAKKIMVIDCVGVSRSILTKQFLINAFPIKNLEKFNNKTFLVTSYNFSKLWKVYHSKLDTLNAGILKEKYLLQTYKFLVKELKK